MTDQRLVTLADLIAKVEAAEGGSRELDRLIAMTLAGATADYTPAGEFRGYYRGGFWVSIGPIEPVTVFVDAALALVERKLPGLQKSVVDLRPVRPCEANIWHYGHFDDVHAKAATPALALCLALLRALSTAPGDGAVSVHAGSEPGASTGTNQSQPLQAQEGGEG